MDPILDKKQKDLEKIVVVRDGEYPLTRIQDAIEIGVRSGVLEIAAQDGDFYSVRWTNVPAVEPVHRTQLCETIVDRIIAVKGEKPTHEPEPKPDILKCPECGREYKTEQGLKKHMASMH